MPPGNRNPVLSEDTASAMTPGNRNPVLSEDTVSAMTPENRKPRFCLRARLQPCRKKTLMRAALAAEVMQLLLSCDDKDLPQGLKPLALRESCGTAEAVPSKTVEVCSKRLREKMERPNPWMGDTPTHCKFGLRICSGNVTRPSSLNVAYGTRLSSKPKRRYSDALISNASRSIGISTETRRDFRRFALERALGQSNCGGTAHGP